MPIDFSRIDSISIEDDFIRNLEITPSLGENESEEDIAWDFPLNISFGPKASSLEDPSNYPSIISWVKRDFSKDRSDRENSMLHRTSFQARLGKKLDRIYQRTLDNRIRLSSHITDVLRIKVERDPRSGDITTRKVESAEVLPVMLPVLRDFPLRRMPTEEGDMIVPSMPFPAEGHEQMWEIYAPLNAQLDLDDLLFRIIEDPYSDRPYIMCLQVKQMSGTLNYSSVLYLRYQVTYYDEKLPAIIVSAIREAYNKRQAVGY